MTERFFFRTASVGTLPVSPARPPAGPDWPIDRWQLGSIREALGDERTAGLLALFAGELRTRGAAIRTAIGRSDLAGAWAEVDSLGGAALNVGGRAVGEAAARLRTVLGAGRGYGATDLHEALRGLDRAIAATLSALRADPQVRALTSA